MTKSLTIRMDEGLLRAMDAEGGKRTRSEVVREAIEAWLAQKRLHAKVARHRAGYQRVPPREDEFASLHAAQVWPADRKTRSRRG